VGPGRLTRSSRADEHRAEREWQENQNQFSSLFEPSLPPCGLRGPRATRSVSLPYSILRFVGFGLWCVPSRSTSTLNRLSMVRRADRRLVWSSCFSRIGARTHLVAASAEGRNYILRTKVHPEIMTTPCHRSRFTQTRLSNTQICPLRCPFVASIPSGRNSRFGPYVRRSTSIPRLVRPNPVASPLKRAVSCHDLGGIGNSLRTKNQQVTPKA
jgi:hypothetical protein